MTQRQKRIGGGVLGAVFALLLTIPVHRLVVHQRLSGCSYPEACEEYRRQIVADPTNWSAWALWLLLGCEDCVFGEGGVMPRRPTARPILGVSRALVPALGPHASGAADSRSRDRGRDRVGWLVRVALDVGTF